MRNQRRWSKSSYVLLIVLLIFVALAPGLDYFLPRHAQAQPEDLDVCATDEFQIQGQEWEIAGGFANLLQGPPPPITDVVDYARIAWQFGQTSLGDGSLDISYDHQVLILVADNFSTPLKTFTHGQYVYEVASRMLLAARTQFKIPDDMIILDQIDVPYNNAENLVQAIRDKLVTYDDQEPKPTLLVLNMSFNLIPCEYKILRDEELNQERYHLPETITLDWGTFYEGYSGSRGDYSLIQYVADTLEGQHNVPESLPEGIPDYGQNIARDIARVIVYDWVSSGSTLLDPLHDYLNNELPGNIPVIPVASAGNYGGYVPMFDPDGNGKVDSFAPASWPEVIGVSSTAVSTGMRSEFSNEGGISAPGEWHSIPISGEYAAGTSFAAPVVSVWAAFMESTSDIGCNFVPWEIDDASNANLVDALWATAVTDPACAPK